ncbi:ParB/RepB/Spo0J family partition protein [Demequina litorisediminis]|uniref:ParB-like N-terminal domain-containing protein n=1 Tax=Demequina litorisediminis TaxID=1849022 RepID=A0ABQ6IJ43_9MICO|nr:ParB/RepB/Spo0J family partition protein [Demequina litorisediminis]GMA37789.1 hypothetical protein GCM10025876_39930 [Demequina litorisediminis]GMA37849.1 hypothetical protein GCM10025876_40530 [Demequina litorisediminis]GMA37890.1 hypothetical protein GCM10025876_40940 [Demequina litorisediminis]GMA37947.1 hypothetical protein GCM10025876_41510 [Demequina litorisediminis]
MHAMTLATVALNEVHPNPANPRYDLGNRDTLTASIKDRGIIQPLVVTPDPEGGYTIIAGHRRHASATDAGLTEILVNIVPDADAATIAAAMVHENTQRAGFTDAELARGIQGMLDTGATAAAIAKGLGAKRDTIKNLAAAHAAPEDTRAYLHAGEISLDQALALADLESKDADLYATTLAAVEDGQNPDWVLRKAREAIAKAEAVAQAEKIAADTGVTIITERPSGWDGKSKHLKSDEEIAQHHGQPCYGIYPTVTNDGEAVVQHWCTKTRAHDPKAETVEVSEDDKAERRRVIANNKAWDTANGVRRAWLTESLHPRTTIPKKHIPTLLALNIATPYSEEHVREAVRIVAAVKNGAWPGAEAHAKATVNDGATLRTHLLATIARHEDRVSKTVWRENRTGFAAHLTLLADLGYTLTPPEAHYVTTHNNGDHTATQTYTTD